MFRTALGSVVAALGLTLLAATVDAHPPVRPGTQSSRRLPSLACYPSARLTSAVASERYATARVSPSRGSATAPAILRPCRSGRHHGHRGPRSLSASAAVKLPTGTIRTSTDRRVPPLASCQARRGPARPPEAGLGRLPPSPVPAAPISAIIARVPARPGQETRGDTRRARSASSRCSARSARGPTAPSSTSAARPTASSTPSRSCRSTGRRTEVPRAGPTRVRRLQEARPPEPHQDLRPEDGQGLALSRRRRRTC